MKTIVIQWETVNGVPFAHFPEPFPMSETEWLLFASVFDRLGFTSKNDQDDIRTSAQTDDAPRQLTDALKGLGYSIEHRGDVPRSIREQ
jgi:hypothetical protein